MQLPVSAYQLVVNEVANNAKLLYRSQSGIRPSKEHSNGPDPGFVKRVVDQSLENLKLQIARFPQNPHEAFTGDGIYRYADGSNGIYEGSLERGLRHGKGVFRDGNGDRYTGLFQRGAT